MFLQTWETRYELLLWLSVVCMIPFDMVKLDSNITTPEGQKKLPTMDRILDLAKVSCSANYLPWRKIVAYFGNLLKKMPIAIKIFFFRNFVYIAKIQYEK